jgi:hypothetical protein
MVRYVHVFSSFGLNHADHITLDMAKLHSKNITESLAGERDWAFFRTHGMTTRDFSKFAIDPTTYQELQPISHPAQHFENVAKILGLFAVYLHLDIQRRPRDWTRRVRSVPPLT